MEEAFYSTDRVMTVSFHKYGEYFPGTGELRDIGVGAGKNYSVNFPLRDGINDKSYKGIFEPTIGWVMEYYKPTAVVLQCGGDSLSGDRLGCFNLSMRGHANCVNFVKSFGLPTLILGGGGYTMRNVARTWAFETGQLVGVEMGPDLPFTDYYEYYSPDFELDVKPSNMDNANSPEYLEKIKNQVLENLKRTTQHAPSVQMQDVPREPLGMHNAGPDGEPETFEEQEDRLDDEDADAGKDARYTQRIWDQKTVRDDEFDESDDEDIAAANGVRRQPGQPRRRGIMDHINPHAPNDESGANTPADDDARSLNGDAMGLDGAAAEADGSEIKVKSPNSTTIPAISSAEAAEEGAKVEEESDNGAAAPAPSAAADDMDVDAAPAAGISTPPLSPPPATVAPAVASATEAEDTEMGEAADPAEQERAREEGERERDLANVEGEAATEMMGGGHNVGAGSAV